MKKVYWGKGFFTMVVHTYTKSLNIKRNTIKKRCLQESLVLLALVITFLIFIDMNMNILTAKSNFETFWKEILV